MGAALSTALGVALVAVGCWPTDASTMLETPASAAGSAASAAGESADSCASGGPSDVLQARVILELDGRPTVWIDVEVQGAEREARSACEALVAQAMAAADATEPPAPTTVADAGTTTSEPTAEALSDAGAETSDRLQPRLARGCSTDAMAVAAVSSPARLIERRELGALELSMATRPAQCPSVEPGSLRAVVLRQSAQASMDQCEATLAALEAMAAETEHQAQSAAAAWLDRAIDLAEKRTAERCDDSALAPPGVGEATAPSAATVDGAAASTAANDEHTSGTRHPPSAGSDASALAPVPTEPLPACERELRVLALLRDRRERISAAAAGGDAGADPDLAGQDRSATSRSCHRGVSSPPR